MNYVTYDIAVDIDGVSFAAQCATAPMVWTWDGDVQAVDNQ